MDTTRIVYVMLTKSGDVATVDKLPILLPPEFKRKAGSRFLNRPPQLANFTLSSTRCTLVIDDKHSIV